MRPLKKNFSTNIFLVDELNTQSNRKLEKNKSFVEKNINNRRLNIATSQLFDKNFNMKRCKKTNPYTQEPKARDEYGLSKKNWIKDFEVGQTERSVKNKASNLIKKSLKFCGGGIDKSMDALNNNDSFRQQDIVILKKSVRNLDESSLQNPQSSPSCLYNESAFQKNSSVVEKSSKKENNVKNMSDVTNIRIEKLNFQQLTERKVRMY